MTSEHFEQLASGFERSLEEIARVAALIASGSLSGTSPLAAMNLAEGASDVVAAGRELLQTERESVVTVREETARTFEMLKSVPPAEWTIAPQSPEIEGCVLMSRLGSSSSAQSVTAPTDY